MSGRSRGTRESRERRPDGGGRRGSRTVRLATGVYSTLVRLLPAAFRAEYGGELVRSFESIAVSARGRGRWAVVLVASRALADLAWRVPLERTSATGGRGVRAGMAGVWRDLRYAARRLRRRPGFAIASVGTLALGIAATTSVFTLVHGVVLSPLPYPDADRLVRVDHGGAGLGIDRGLGVAYGFYRFYADRTRRAEAMAMYSERSFTLTGAGDPVKLSGLRATPSLGTVLGVVPLAGRWLGASDAAPEAAAVVVLSHRLWQERFGADPAAVGRVVRLDGLPTEIVGVTGPDFAFPAPEIDLWVPRAVPASGVGGWNESAVARLTPGSTAGDLETELASLLPALRETTDDPGRVASYLDDAGITPRIVPLKDSVVGDVRATLWILMGSVGLVLLIALANVANLFLVRAEEGQRETAVRTALGAGHARILRGYLAETLLVAMGAGVVGLALAYQAVEILKRRAPVNVPRIHEVGLDPAVLALGGGGVLLAALVLGLIPAFRPEADLGSGLRDGGWRTTAGRRRLSGRNLLVTVQVALAVILLVGSGLLFRTFQELRSVDPGFETRQALTFEIGLAGEAYGTREEMIRFHRDLLERLRAVPGVIAAGAVGSCLPLTPHMCWGETLEAEGRRNPEGEVPPVTGVRIVTPGYFEALRIPVRGRTFRDADGSDIPVAVISESTARAYVPGEDALGRRIRIDGDGPWHLVVGVAADVKGRIETDEFLRTIYLPMRPESAGPPPTPVSYVLRTAVAPASLVDQVRQAVADLDPAVPVASVETLRDRIDRATGPAAFALVLVGLAAAIALLLGSVGVYAVVAYGVSRRTGEIGIRMAMGATGADVRRLVVRQGGLFVLAGILVGVGAALLLSRVLRGMLYGVAPTDPGSYGVVIGLMGAVAALALYVPARRASRVDPVEAIARR